MEENTWARLRDSCPDAHIIHAQPSPHIILHICSVHTTYTAHMKSFVPASEPQKSLQIYGLIICAPCAVAKFLSIPVDSYLSALPLIFPLLIYSSCEFHCEIDHVSLP